MRLPPPAIRWPASSGISATLDCMRSRMTALTAFKSPATKASIGSSEGAVPLRRLWIVAVMECPRNGGYANFLARRERQSREQATEILAGLEVYASAIDHGNVTDD